MNGNLLHWLFGSVLLLCATGLMTWLGWLTIVTISHTEKIVGNTKEIEYLKDKR